VDEAYLHVTVRDAQAARAPELVRGSEVRCYLWREDDARYEFRTAVAYSEGTPQTWSLLHSANLHRVQARNYYRVRYNQETTIGVLGASGAAAEEADTAVPRRVITRLRGRICSLSAGGLALVTQQGVHTQARLRVALEIPEEEPFDADVETVGVEPISGGRYLVRGMFVRIGEDKRDVIARYVLRRQRPLAASPEKSAGERGLVEQE
jgi:c-di-GMP-binding flagellar brake protein YcgR